MTTITSSPRKFKTIGDSAKLDWEKRVRQMTTKNIAQCMSLVFGNYGRITAAQISTLDLNRIVREPCLVKGVQTMSKPRIVQYRSEDKHKLVAAVLEVMGGYHVEFDGCNVLYSTDVKVAA